MLPWGWLEPFPRPAHFGQWAPLLDCSEISPVDRGIPRRFKVLSLASAAGDELRATRKTTDTTLPPNPSLTFDEGNVSTKPVPVVSTASPRIDPRFDCHHEFGIYFLVF